MFSQLQDHQSQPHTTQNIHGGSVMYEFLDTPNKISSNHHHIPPREMHMTPIISQLTNKIQCQTMVTMTQINLDRRTPITPPSTTHNTQCTPTKTTTTHQHQQTYYLTSLRLHSTLMNNFWIWDGQHGNTMCHCRWVMVVKYNRLRITMTKTNMILKLIAEEIGEDEGVGQEAIYNSCGGIFYFCGLYGHFVCNIIFINLNY